MSFTSFLEKEEAKLGVFTAFLEGHIGVALTVINAIDAALKNPIVDGVLLVVLPPSISVHLPQAEALLETIITDLTIGTSIEQDIAGAPTPEAKVKIFLEDLQKYNVFLKHALLKKLLSLFLAGLDNNALTEVMYDTYAQIKYAEANKTA